MGRVMMLSEVPLGGTRITMLFGGNEAKARAAKVSIIRFTHSICVTESGGCLHMNDPTPTTKQAQTFTVSWNSMKRCMLR